MALSLLLVVAQATHSPGSFLQPTFSKFIPASTISQMSDVCIVRFEGPLETVQRTSDFGSAGVSVKHEFIRFRASVMASSGGQRRTVATVLVPVLMKHGEGQSNAQLVRLKKGSQYLVIGKWPRQGFVEHFSHSVTSLNPDPSLGRVTSADDSEFMAFGIWPCRETQFSFLEQPEGRAVDVLIQLLAKTSAEAELLSLGAMMARIQTADVNGERRWGPSVDERLVELFEREAGLRRVVAGAVLSLWTGVVLDPFLEDLVAYSNTFPDVYVTPDGADLLATFATKDVVEGKDNVARSRWLLELVGKSQVPRVQEFLLRFSGRSYNPELNPQLRQLLVEITDDDRVAEGIFRTLRDWLREPEREPKWAEIGSKRYLSNKEELKAYWLHRLSESSGPFAS